MLLQTQYFIDQISFTSVNIKKGGKIEKLVSFFRNQILDSAKLTIIHKTLKVARHVMTNKIILNYTNTELLLVNTQKKQQAQHISL